MQNINCMGERYIACSAKGEEYILNGVPGNAMGAYLDGADVKVYGNAQDAVGDTMNAGNITIYGSAGDAVGYAMRGGEIYIRDNAGYRVGIHMKAYKEKIPVIVVGNKCGSFLGEYQAGGYIIVLGLNLDGEAPVGRFCATGMHGGKMFLRCKELPFDIPEQICAQKASAEDMALIDCFIDRFCEKFSVDKQKVLSEDFYVLTPNSKNPYHQLYVQY